MVRKASTFRLDPVEQERLRLLSKLLRTPMNRLVNEAVAAYVERRSKTVEKDLKESLERIWAYRERDPDFEQAIAAFAEAEASLDDPVEGQLVEEVGPIRAEIMRLLNG